MKKIPRQIADEIVVRIETTLNDGESGETVQNTARNAGIDGFAYMHPSGGNRIVYFCYPKKNFSVEDEMKLFGSESRSQPIDASTVPRIHPFKFNQKFITIDKWIPGTRSRM